jgi:hypothetical protein
MPQRNPWVATTPPARNYSADCALQKIKMLRQSLVGAVVSKLQHQIRHWLEYRGWIQPGTPPQEHHREARPSASRPLERRLLKNNVTADGKDCK